MVMMNHVILRNAFVFLVVAGLVGVSLRDAWASPSVPVTVVNPASKPALTSSVDDPGRTAYQSTSNMTGNCSTEYCHFTFGPIPQGYRLVVQHISGVLDVNAQDQIAITSYVTIPNILSAFSVPSTTVCYFDEPVQFYVDGSETLTVEADAGNTVNFSSAGGVTNLVTVTGYLLDCSAAPCAPIAH